ncbi:MAG: sigma 54 modulation/S30EA ribosomal C-terminal domain-containing protein [Candidatus Limousia pullorum]
MSVEEAIEIMNDRDFRFYTFQNIKTGRINVVYALDGEGYGLVDPKI